MSLYLCGRWYIGHSACSISASRTWSMEHVKSDAGLYVVSFVLPLNKSQLFSILHNKLYSHADESTMQAVVLSPSGIYIVPVACRVPEPCRS